MDSAQPFSETDRAVQVPPTQNPSSSHNDLKHALSACGQSSTETQQLGKGVKTHLAIPVLVSRATTQQNKSEFQAHG